LENDAAQRRAWICDLRNGSLPVISKKPRTSAGKDFCQTENARTFGAGYKGLMLNDYHYNLLNQRKK